MAHLFGGGQLDFHDNNCQSRQPTEANQNSRNFFQDDNNRSTVNESIFNNQQVNWNVNECHCVFAHIMNSEYPRD